MATKPNPRGTRPPGSGTNRRMMTPPPATRKSTGAMPAAGKDGNKSSGAMAPVQTPPPAGGGGQGGPEGARAQGTPPQRPVAKLKTRGMPIKTKIVLGMSGLTVGVSLLIFLIVMMIATSSLDETIEQAGVGMLQQAEAIHRPYRAGLNEKGLISYFSQPANRDTKFGDYWTQIQDQWFHPRIPGCREFANWEQLKDDRVWVKVAVEVLRNDSVRNRLSEDDKLKILGQGYNELKELDPEGSGRMREPNSPRKINETAMERYKVHFTELFERYRLNASSDPFARLRQAIHAETHNKLIHSPNGVRKKIFREFKNDFIADLDDLTGNENSQVRFVIIEVPGETLPGFTMDELRVISPRPDGPNLPVSSSSDVSNIGDITVDRGASVKDIPAYAFSKSIGGNESIRIYLDRQEIQSRKTNLMLSILGISVVGIGLAVFLAFLIGGGITKPLQTLMNDIQVISGGNFDHKPKARSNDEIGIVSRLLGDMAAGLKSAQAVWAENQSRKHDLDVAKEIQENLLPKHVPRIAGYDVSAYYSPSKEVGGDYYDFFLVDKTHLGMICADVSGKGIPGSMVMMMAKALVSYEAQNNLSPRDIFCKVNRTLAKDIKRGMFVTAFYMLLDIPTARLTVASAGHNPLLLYRAATKQCVEVNPGGIALGFDKDGRLFERNMKEEVVQLQRGDRAVIYTDGVTEAMSPGGEEFGEERMNAITIQAASRGSSEYLTTLVNAIQAHAQADDQHDDITIVTLKVG